MNIKQFKLLKDVFRKKDPKDPNKKGAQSNTNNTTKKSKGLTGLMKKFTRPFLDILSRYSVQQEEIVGLDITPKSVRVAQLNNVKNKWILEKLAYKFVEVPAGTPNDKSAEIYVEQIKEAIVSGKISTVNTAVSLPVSSAIIKVISAPLMTDDEIERAIEHESLWQNLIQLQDELDSYSIFYQVISRNSKTNTMDILFVASKLVDVKAQVNLVKQAGLNPIIVDIRCFSLRNALDLIRAQSTVVQKTPIALLEFGQIENYLLIMRSDTPHITDVFINTQDKQNLATQNPQNLEGIADRYAMQVKQAFAAYESKYKTDPVKDLYVVTSIQSFEKFVKALQKKLKKLNIQIFNPLDNVIIPENLEKKFKAEINPSVFTSVIGLATRKLDVFGYYKFVTGVKNINLLPNRDLVRKSKRTEWISRLGFIGASAFALFFIITSTFSYFGEMKKTKKQLTDYTALEQNVNTMKTKLTKVNTQIKNIETKVKIGEAIHSNQKSSFLVLSHINKSVPKGIKLMSLNYDGNKKLVITGSAKGDQNILDFISKLKKGKEIKNAIVKSMSNIEKDKDNPSNLKKFTIDTIINTEQPKKEKEE